jgi:hypothetical protein
MEYLRAASGRGGNSSSIDFDEEGRKAMAALGVDGSLADDQNNLTPIWRHPEGGGSIYVGNIYVAQQLATLNKFNIRAVVNCTHGHGALPNFHERTSGGPRYYTFPISQWFNHMSTTSSGSVYAFTDPMFAFIEEAVSGGENVLVHCLAGAHRAGTTGVSCLMHFAGMNQVMATKIAKKLRPIIDPIGQLPLFLERLEVAQHERRTKARTVQAAKGWGAGLED